MNDIDALKQGLTAYYCAELVRELAELDDQGVPKFQSGPTMRGILRKYSNLLKGASTNG